jgi:hypothetical protein
VYAYLSRGVIGPRVLNWRVKTELYETHPLDGGSSTAYRDLVRDKLRTTRAQALAVITRPFHRYFYKQEVNLICWFNENDKRPLGVVDLMNAEPADSEKTWHVRADAISGTNEQVGKSPLLFAINMLSADDTARKTYTELAEGTEPGFLKEPKELLLNSVFRFLQDREYINPDHTLSAWGKALKVSLDRAKSNGYSAMAMTSTEVEEALLVAFELLRHDILSSKPMFDSPPLSGQPMRGSDTDKANTLLISRIASLGLLNHKEIGYTGPLSRHLLAYHQMAAAVRNAARDLLEAHACGLLLSGAALRDWEPKMMRELGATLPFVREPDLGLALVVKSYLDELSNDPAKRSDVRSWFSHATDIDGDLEKAWKMWDAVNAGIQGADSSIVNHETRKLFKNADEWLERKKATTNGA